MYIGDSGDTPGGIPITTTSAGTIQFGGSDNYIYGLDYGGYSFGRGITVLGDGSYNEIDAYYGPMVNDGVIEDNTSGGTLTIDGTGTTNLVGNGSFATGDFSHWTVTPASSGSNISVGNWPIAPLSGFNYEALFGANQFIPDSISQTLATVPGDTYTLSYWVSNGITVTGKTTSRFSGRATWCRICPM